LNFNGRSFTKMAMIMSRSRVETQKIEVTQGAGDSDSDLTKAINFAALISMSSLRASGCQDGRLTGREEIAARLAEQANASGFDLPFDSSISSPSNFDPVFEYRVADQLELRGHTFEAGLYYRRLLTHPAVAKRLAFLLDRG
jgi:hypothetical protein